MTESTDALRVDIVAYAKRRHGQAADAAVANMRKVLMQEGQTPVVPDPTLRVDIVANARAKHGAAAASGVSAMAKMLRLDGVKPVGEDR